MSMEGDWVCGTCQLPNFHWRTKCRRCNAAFGSLSREHTGALEPRIWAYRPGDWYCDAGLCRAHNFATRQYCFRCHTIKSIPFYSGPVGYQNLIFPPMILGQSQRVAQISRRGWTAGDWFCLRPYCNAHNYGTRVRCYKCKRPKDLVASGLQNQ